VDGRHALPVFVLFCRPFNGLGVLSGNQLYNSLLIAEAVWDELNAAGQYWPGRNEVAAAHWIQRRTPGNRLLVMALNQDIDKGENEPFDFDPDQEIMI
jgi:predicted nucleic acid-binding protein